MASPQGPLESGRLKSQRLDPCVETAFAARRLILVDQALVDRRVNDRDSSAERSLSFLEITGLDRQDDFLDEGAQTAAHGGIVSAVLFRLKRTFFC